MVFKVAFSAHPHNIQRLWIVVVVSFWFCITAQFTWFFYNFTELYVNMQVAPGIASSPRLGRRGRFVLSTPLVVTLPTISLLRRPPWVSAVAQGWFHNMELFCHKCKNIARTKFDIKVLSRMNWPERCISRPSRSGIRSNIIQQENLSNRCFGRHKRNWVVSRV